MSVSAELARLLAAEVLGRPDLEPEVLEQTAARLEGLLARVRAMDQNLLAELEPAGGFDPSHPTWSQPAPDPAWARLGAPTPGSSGYGAAGRGGTGAPAGRTAAETGAAAASPGSGAAATAPAALPGAELGYLSLTEVADRIRRRELGAEEVTRAMLDRVAALQPRLNAFITVTAEAALAAARAADAALARGEDGGPLCGVPIALKDLYETAGVRTTGGSRVLADHVPRRDATAWARLRAAGAVLLGKTGTHEFAFGPTNNNPHYGPVRNPWQPEHVSGGSSGGSGAAVAAGAAYLGMGTDTGGSIRIPAAACGTVGLKATYGRVSRYGILPLSWSLDHAGPLTRTVRDAALVLQVLAGPDPLDHTALAVPPGDYVTAVDAAAGLQGLRVGVDAAWLADRIDPGVAAAVQAALRTLRDLGAEVVEVQLPPPDTMMLVNRLIALGEAGAYHAGHLQTRAREYGEDVRARMELGQFLLARDYLVGQRLRGELARTVSAVLQQVDLIASPALPVPAPPIGQNTLDWGSSQETVAEALIRTTAPFNVTGHPAISVPCGLTPAGLPAGLQLAGRPFEETTVLRAAAAFEAAAPHPLRPPL